MNWWQIALVVLVLGAVAWKFRAKIIHGTGHFSRNLTAADFADGKVPAEYMTACAEMQRSVSAKVSKFYGRTYDYHFPLSMLVQRFNVVDSLPGGAAAHVFRTTPNGPTTMEVVPSRADDIRVVKHEMCHALTWDQPELWEQCQKYEGGHWPLIFDEFGSY